MAEPGSGDSADSQGPPAAAAPAAASAPAPAPVMPPPAAGADDDGVRGGVEVVQHPITWGTGGGMEPTQVGDPRVRVARGLC